jgi:hypothetical protein
MRFVIAAAIAVALVVPASASASNSITQFQTQSKDIGCAYVHFEGEKPSLRCDVFKMDREPPKPSWCELDYGSAFSMTARSRARRICHGDTVFNPRAKKLPYNKTRRFGPFRCRATVKRLRCVNRAEHGFALSRHKQRLF